MKTLKQWREEKGLADPGVKDQGPPRIKNKVVVDRYKIPEIPTFTFDKDRGIATKVDG